MARERIRIEGMSCQHCVEAVRRALKKVGADIHDVGIGQAEISYSPAVNQKTVDDAIVEAGFRPVGRETLA